MVSHLEENQCSLVELVVGTRNHQLYKKGEESRGDKLNGRELCPEAFSRPLVILIYERQSRPGETYEECKKRSIVLANPKREVFNAYLGGDELVNGGGSCKVPVTYCRINQ